jgi:hypothetical protein
MPNDKNDPKRNNKKMHIGNNYTNIIYCDNSSYNVKTINSQFNFFNIIIYPHEEGLNRYFFI